MRFLWVVVISIVAAFVLIFVLIDMSSSALKMFGLGIVFIVVTWIFTRVTNFKG